MWKRIPVDIKVTEEEIAFIWNSIGAELFRGDSPSVHKAIKEHAWSADLKPYAEALQLSIRKRNSELIEGAFVTIGLEHCLNLLGLDSVDDVLRFRPKWAFESQKATFLPMKEKPNEGKDGELGRKSEDKIKQLAQFVSFLEN